MINFENRDDNNKETLIDIGQGWFINPKKILYVEPAKDNHNEIVAYILRFTDNHFVRVTLNIFKNNILPLLNIVQS